MMSAAQSQTLEAKLEALQCHFTWELNPGRSKLFRVRDKLEDIGTEEGNSWLGHIYNLRGYIQYKLGFTEDAQSLFNQATEALRLTRGAEEGPWLVVNYGNLAWLHHHLGEQEESQDYLSKVDALMKKYPSPSQDELHPEILAEIAWTLMKFSAKQRLLAAVYFERAIRTQTDMVEWNTSRVLALESASKDPENKVEVDILKEMEDAKKRDPENLYLAALYLEACAKKIRFDIKEEARELGREVLKRPVSSYSGNTPILRLYRKNGLKDEAIELAEEALRRHPGERFLKWSAANCYKWVLEDRKDPALQKEIDRGISLCKEVISLYSHHSLKIKIALANMYLLLNNQDEAEKIFVELHKIKDLEEAELKLLNINCRKIFQM
ncbi:interferon-induced protein with tetratricopeptide repeats 5-like isoform X3 [Dicentrarchus labrax]|uniref:interferon-induced protein with tetratricopeptide repeats 5-like isoform X1 n=1 Tax=Dicentrarchus labrax TaxID=13489 RepID=UPI0021F55402|nr:interferon-induced protein with tetratricopeptide repeats 5-like isoform X1 [Dicentrarchus labrax]XP_051231735.1 interferon-induced protein with tetratricopeptide repeats 5-like isoform X2 [Dicentrarchus labrax]XP_051231736.1 interferon-induced protein with tetratricopeptide repeats 5-like isoform X3 [Dicentrarchus labrax]